MAPRQQPQPHRQLIRMIHHMILKMATMILMRMESRPVTAVNTNTNWSVRVIKCAFWAFSSVGHATSINSLVMEAYSPFIQADIL